MIATALCVGGGLAVCIAAATASPQPLPHIYTLVDLGSVPAPDCPCIGTPFSLPAYRVGDGYADGAAAPEGGAPASAADRKRYAAERALIGRDVEAGRAGDPGASLSVALHLSERPEIAGDDRKVQEEAARWLYLAARDGSPDAAMFLGYRYRRGNGVEQSDEAAAYWFHQAATAGNNVAMVALGLLYSAGRGVPQDPAAAIWWWRKAQPTTPLASRFLGDAYACGIGAARDPALAVREYKKSSERGDDSANIQLGQMHANGCAAADDGAAVKAFRRAADAGYPEAQVALSELIRQGRGEGPNPDEAYYWARLAERRLPSGALHARATAAAKAAAAFMVSDAVAAADRMVDQVIAEARKSIR
jgi:TPR repeat protein